VTAGDSPSRSLSGKTRELARRSGQSKIRTTSAKKLIMLCKRAVMVLLLRFLKMRERETRKDNENQC
jgi:hypothetical protein